MADAYAEQVPRTDQFFTADQIQAHLVVLNDLRTSRLKVDDTTTAEDLWRNLLARRRMVDIESEWGAEVYDGPFQNVGSRALTLIDVDTNLVSEDPLLLLSGVPQKRHTEHFRRFLQRHNIVRVSLLTDEEKVRYPDTAVAQLGIESFLYTRWPDQGVISSHALFHDLVLPLWEIYHANEPPTQGFWIHCLAGLGRTGTLAVALLAYWHIRTQAAFATRADLLSFLAETVTRLRDRRNAGLVQTLEQWQLLVEFGERYLLLHPCLAQDQQDCDVCHARTNFRSAQSCQATCASTGLLCRRYALPRQRFCWQHKPRD